MDWGLAGSVTLSGLALVFMVLILLIFLVELTGRAVRGGASKKTEAAPVPPKPAEIQAAKSAPIAVPAVQDGIADETVAVISAAIYSCLDSSASGTRYAIREIRRAQGERPAWGFAGMQQNTRPF